MKAYDSYFTSLPLSRHETLFHIYKKLENTSFSLTKFTGNVENYYSYSVIGIFHHLRIENLRIKPGHDVDFFPKILKQLANSQ